MTRTTATQTHTPTPWAYAIEGSCAAFIVEADSGDTVLHLKALLNSNQQRQLEANAAHIVRCVNEREKLLKALTACMTALDSLDKATGYHAGEEQICLIEYANTLYGEVEALARATQEEG